MAITERNNQITYGDLATEVFAYAGYLKEKGIGKRDRVLVFVPVSIELYKTVLALIAIGAVPVFLDQWSSLKRLKQSAELADCKALLAGWKLRLLAFFISVFRTIPVKLKPGKKGKPIIWAEAMERDDAALITFTTGSSGTPKAAWRTHDFLFQQHSALLKELKPEPGDVNMTTLPVFVFSNLAAGLTTILPDFNPRRPESQKPEVILRDLQKANTLICSPDFLMRLVGFMDQKANKNLSALGNLKEVFTGGAPVSPQMAVKIEKHFPQTIVAYGSTEAEPISSISVKELAAYHNARPKGIPVGRLHEDIELRIIPVTDKPLKPRGEEWLNMSLAPNEIGEIVVAGPHVLKHYYKNPEAQARQKFEVNGQLWHRTGDSGILDENGNLFLTGPAKYLFKQNGKWLGQFPLEMQLNRLATIKEATILHKSGETIIFLVKKSGVSETEVQAEIQHTNLRYNSIKFLDELPKDPRHHSKIEYGKLLSL
jgi:acyl-CoA synthetase (AMP-forming)/AMP-acid ligase II